MNQHHSASPSALLFSRHHVKWNSSLVVALALAASILLPHASAQTTTTQPEDKYQQGLEHRTTVKVLPNGLTLIISERHEAPVFSFYTLVNAGSANDPQGESGLAHMF